MPQKNKIIIAILIILIIIFIGGGIFFVPKLQQTVLGLETSYSSGSRISFTAIAQGRYVSDSCTATVKVKTPQGTETICEFCKLETSCNLGACKTFNYYAKTTGKNLLLIDYFCAKGTKPNSDQITFEIVDKCSDEDGTNIYLSGRVIKGSQIQNDRCVDGKLIEYVCENNLITPKEYSCPSGYKCDNGACKSTITEPIDSLPSCSSQLGTCYYFEDGKCRDGKAKLTASCAKDDYNSVYICCAKPATKACTLGEKRNCACGGKIGKDNDYVYCNYCSKEGNWRTDYLIWQQCGANNVCENANCIAKPSKVCDNIDFSDDYCVGNIVYNCNGDGTGFDKISCGDYDCSDGNCISLPDPLIEECPTEDEVSNAKCTANSLEYDICSNTKLKHIVKICGEDQDCDETELSCVSQKGITTTTTLPKGTTTTTIPSTEECTQKYMKFENNECVFDIGTFFKDWGALIIIVGVILSGIVVILIQMGQKGRQ